ncbi:MAG TPA: S8 family serine peptidase [Polyangiaceae bacterium]
MSRRPTGNFSVLGCAGLLLLGAASCSSDDGSTAQANSPARGAASAPAAPPAPPPEATILPADGSKPQQYPAGSVVSVASDGKGSSQTVAVPSPDAVIIELTGAPAARSARGAGVSQAAVKTLSDQRGRVAAQVLQIVQGSRPGALKRDVLPREYGVVFQGFAARIPPATQARIRALPEVRAIHPDGIARTNLAESLWVIKAVEFWSNQGHIGAGTTIAVLDTGVDYSHADLGGCMGPTCKVRGGYDFVNNDADPRDDNGHGTHVAAVAAGRGSTPGVAPQASVLAYKVCTASGYCDFSTIIAGLERAADPNGDLNTADHATVVNLSIGGTGDADDVLSQAVDNATAAGVIVVAAAGNNGSYFTVGSPGAARTAITVGATDKADQRAYFSSRGPTANSYGLKPEVTAPGVDICAAKGVGTALGPDCRDTTHASSSGTSMATPHVAGAAALLAGKFPTLTPAEIKALLVNNSQDLGLDAMTQGAGRINLDAAGAAQTLVTPPTVSFGLADTSGPIFAPSRTLTVRNRSTAARTYSLSVPALPSGITASVSPASFSLAPGASTTVTLNLRVDNALVPALPTAPYTYQGVVAVSSGTEVQRVPFAFLKAAELHIHSDEVPMLIYVHNGSNFSSVTSGSGTEKVLLLSEGTYDVHLRFLNGASLSFAFKEGISVKAGTTHVTLNRTDAVHAVDFTTRDQNNQPLTTQGGVYKNLMVELDHKPSNFSLTSFYVGSPGSVHQFGNLSTAYDVSFGSMVSAWPTYYVFSGGFNGLAASRDISTTSADLTRTKVQYYTRPGESNLGDNHYVYMPKGGMGFLRRSGAELTHDLYISDKGARVPMGYLKYLNKAGSTFDHIHVTGLVREGSTPGSIQVVSLRDYVTPVFSSSTGELPLNAGPAFWFERFNNTASGMSMAAIGDSPWAFHTQGGDAPNERTKGWSYYYLAFGPTVVKIGSLGQSQNGFTSAQAQLAPGAYTLLSDGPEHYVGKVKTQTIVRAEFDTRKADANPPWTPSIQLRANGKLTPVVIQGQQAVLTFKVMDEALSSVNVTYGTPPTTAGVTALGSDQYQVTISNCQLGGVRMTLIATDASGNSLRQDFPAAFECTTDLDSDLVPDSIDNCPTVANANQADADKNGVGDACASLP